MQKRTNLRGLLFLFILIFFSQNLFAIENSVKNLLTTWNDFWALYSEIDFNAANKTPAPPAITPLLNNLIFQLEEFSKSDAYITETNGKKSESALYIDKALEHALNAQTALTQNNQNTQQKLSDFQKEVSLLTIQMNQFMKSEIDSDRNFMILFVELLCLISFLSIAVVLGAAKYIKNNQKIAFLNEKNKAEELVTKTITRVQESERSRISHDLHDTVLQDMRTALLFVHKLEESEKLAPEEKDILNKVNNLEKQNMKNIRNIIRNLTPPEIETDDFALLLNEYALNTEENSGLPCKFYAAESELYKKLSPIQKLHIFRIVQESLTNAIKHSGASELSLIVREENGSLVFLISDDGRGFSENDKKDNFSEESTHLGLKGMKSRAEILGAELIVNSNSESGTQVRLTVGGFQESEAT